MAALTVVERDIAIIKSASNPSEMRFATKIVPCYMLFNVEKHFCLYKSIAICNRKYKDIREVSLNICGKLVHMVSDLQLKRIRTHHMRIFPGNIREGL